MVIRKRGRAWNQPFVVAYAPRHADQPAFIEGLEHAGDDAWKVHGDGWTAMLQLDGSELTYDVCHKENNLTEPLADGDASQIPGR